MRRLPSPHLQVIRQLHPPQSPIRPKVLLINPQTKTTSKSTSANKIAGKKEA